MILWTDPIIFVRVLCPATSDNEDYVTRGDEELSIEIR